LNFSHLFIVLSLIFYVGASALYIHSYPKLDKRKKIFVLAFTLFTCATLTVTATLVTSTYYGFYVRVSGLLLIAIVSWLTIAGHYLFKIKTMGIFVAPIVSLILLFQILTVPVTDHVAASPPSALATSHVVLAILGEAFVFCAFCIASLYLVQHRALKAKQFSLLSSATLPLDKLDNLLAKTLWAGFIFLSLGLITGAIYTQFYGESPTTVNVEWKVFWATIVWIWYLGTLLSRNIFRFSGRRIAQLCLGGFVLISISLFGLL
jgi:ABC-type uncharacterized transport system permease subunit